MIVVDSSAAVLGLLNEGDARRSLADEAVAVPHLADAEIANALRSGVRRGGRWNPAKLLQRVAQPPNVLENEGKRRGGTMYRMRRVGATIAVAFAAVLLFAAPASAQIVADDLTGSLTPTDLAQNLAGEGVTVSNVTFTGDDRAGGTFSGGSGIIGFDQGIILSSGSVGSVVGPNDATGFSDAFGQPGDSDLDTLSGTSTFDAAVLEFDFVPNASTVTFEYVFGSEEYNEFVGSQFNDAFAFFVNGQNCATVGGEPVSINTINNDTNSDAFIDNTDGAADTQMDGFTVVLTCSADVDPNVTNTMKLAIADAGDETLNAWVLLQGSSLTTDGDGYGPTDDAIDEDADADGYGPDADADDGAIDEDADVDADADDGGVAPDADADADADGGPVTTVPGPGELPRTGTDTGPFVGIGAALLVAGAISFAAGRRNRPTSTHSR